MRKRVIFIADSLDNASKFQRVLLRLDMDIVARSTAQMRKIINPRANIDLVIFESKGQARLLLEEVISLAESGGYPLLVIIEEEDVKQLKLPNLIPRDFVIESAGQIECAARVRRLLESPNRNAHSNVLTVDSMDINLDTYQVVIADEPIDLTYLEYALLTFLVQHPNRTFTRQSLLQHVWGFDYYGGPRTVDVHVRRIRSKIGPSLAQYLETVRGVGYLWSSH